MKGRTPTAEEKRHMARVGQLTCIVCTLQNLGDTPAALHHIDGRTKEGAHYQVIPLCSLHHQNGGYGVALHAGKAEFELCYGSESYLLQQTNLLLEKAA